MQAVSKSKRFDPGEIVYARFFGDKPLVVGEILIADSSFPHYFCVSEGDTHLIPMIHLSRRDLVPLVGDGNRRQLELPLASP